MSKQNAVSPNAALPEHKTHAYSATQGQAHPHTHLHSQWYVSAMEQLVGVVQELSQTRSLDSIASIVRNAARNLTGADGATFILREGDQCYYADESAITPLWKGKRFPMEACVSGWAMLHGESVVIEDIYSDPRVPVEAYRPTFVKSMVMVPIRRTGNSIGAIGNYWASHRLPTSEEVSVLQALAQTTAVAIENVELYGQLQAQVRTLQKQQTRITEQHEALEVFARALSHDLKEPTRTMISFSHILQDKQLSPEDRAKYLEYIERSAVRMGMLIDAVFQYTVLDDPSRASRETVSMQNVLEGVKENLTQLIRERGANVRGGHLPDVKANQAQMIQVIQNLTANAIRHNDKKVVITVQAEEKENEWLFSVSDNGVGIAPEYIEKIFQPFKRLASNEDCSGLGLSICRKIVDSYGGAIWCESAPGHGASFNFTLPKGDVIAPSEKPQTLAHILLVDDRPADIELTKAMLLDYAKMECNVVIAHGGAEAYDIMKDKSHKADNIDLVLLDVNMPGMDGFDLLERMRSDDLLKEIPVVMCSGSTYEQDRRRAESLGAIGYLVKPPSLEKLEPMLENVPALLLHHEGKASKLLRKKL